MKIPGFGMPKLERNDYSLWITPDSFSDMYHACNRCGYSMYYKPTKFCGECGAVMLNAIEAMAEYDAYGRKLDEEKEKENV